MTATVTGMYDVSDGSVIRNGGETIVTGIDDIIAAVIKNDNNNGQRRCYRAPLLEIPTAITVGDDVITGRY